MSRLDNIKKVLDEGINNETLDGILITAPINQYYLTEFRLDDGYVLVTRGKSYVFADSRYIEAAKMQIKSDYEIVLLRGKQTDYLGSVLDGENVKKLGFEDTSITFAAYQTLKNNFPGIELKPVGNILEKLRERKDASEIDKITKAQKITDDAFSHILNYITPDKTERDVASELEYYMRGNGAEGLAFKVIAVSGTASSLPHGNPRDVKLEKGFFTMDFGCIVNGYHSDMTRTVCIGKAGDEVKKVYDVCLGAQLRALEVVGYGVKCSDADKAARDYMAGYGYADYFGHSLGHGVGLQIHESPRLASTSPDVLTYGNVTSVEPGIYLEGKYGVRIEDLIVITENGVVNLTKSPKDLIEIC